MEERDKLILKIMHLAYLVHVETDYCVFIDFSGHVDSLQISIRESVAAWEVDVLETEFDTAFQDTCESGEHHVYLKAKIQILEQILAGQEIAYENLDYEEMYSKKYYF